MVMALPFVLGLLAAVFAYYGRRNSALFVGVAIVGIQVWWLMYHATDSLSIGL